GFEDVAPADGGDAGVVHQYVDATPAAEDVAHESIVLREAADVGLDEARLARRADEPLRLAGRVLVAGVVDGDGVAVTGQLDADAPAYAATAAGDQGDGMRVHGCSG